MSYQSPSVESRSTSTMAIVSLIAGILGFTFFPLIGSLVAVITGPMAKNEIKQSRGALEGDGLATAGIVMGWVGIALSVIGCCFAFFVFLLPLLLIPLGLSIKDYSLLLPILLGFL